MASGPGKYDLQCTRTLHELRAKCVILLVVNGAQGSGFSVASTDPALVHMVPAALRQIADAVEADLRSHAS